MNIQFAVNEKNICIDMTSLLLVQLINLKDIWNHGKVNKSTDTLFSKFFHDEANVVGISI